MSTVNLDNGLHDPLLDSLHAVQFLVQDPSGFHRINGFEVIALPLNVHHDGQRSLGMSSLFRRHLMGSGHRQISSGPQADVFRHGPSGACHEIGDTLKAGKLHIIAVFLFVLPLFLFCGSTAGEQSFHHEL